MFHLYIILFRSLSFILPFPLSFSSLFVVFCYVVFDFCLLSFYIRFVLPLLFLWQSSSFLFLIWLFHICFYLISFYFLSLLGCLISSRAYISSYLSIFSSSLLFQYWCFKVLFKIWEKVMIFLKLLVYIDDQFGNYIQISWLKHLSGFVLPARS